MVIIGQLLPNVIASKAIAQGKAKSAEFDTVTCQSLKVVDAVGKVWAHLEVTKFDTEPQVNRIIQVFNRVGVPVYYVGTSSDGGLVNVQGKDGIHRAGMFVSPDGGTIGVFGNDRASGVSMWTDSDGGLISVRGKDSKPRVGISVDSNGGDVAVFGSDGKRRAQIGVTNYGNGSINTWDKNGYKTGNLP